MSDLDLDALYRKHANRLTWYVRGKTGCPETAEDIVHEGFRKLLVCVEKSADIEHPVAFWTSAIDHLVIDWYRAGKRAAKALVAMGREPRAAHATPDVHIYDDELERLTDTELARLPHRCRAVMTLARSGVPDAEIGASLRITRSGVQKHKRDGRVRLESLRRLITPPPPEEKP